MSDCASCRNWCYHCGKPGHRYELSLNCALFLTSYISFIIWLMDLKCRILFQSVEVTVWKPLRCLRDVSKIPLLLLLLSLYGPQESQYSNVSKCGSNSTKASEIPLRCLRDASWDASVVVVVIVLQTSKKVNIQQSVVGFITVLFRDNIERLLVGLLAECIVHCGLCDRYFLEPTAQ